MKLWRFLLALVLSWSAAMAGVPTSSRPHQPKIAAGEWVRDRPALDRVIAAIDGEPVTWSDFQRFVSSAPEGRNIQLRDYLTQILLEKEAQAAGIAVDGKEVEAYIGEVRRQNGLSPEEFAEALRTQGLTREEYESQIREDIARSRFIATRFRSKIAISDDEVERYLTEHPAERIEKPSVRLKQILVPYGAEPKLAVMRQQLLNGDRWEMVGKEHYADLGYVSVDDLLPEIAAAAGKLKPGEVSELIETANGSVLISVSERVEGGMSKEQVERIREQLAQLKLREDLDAFLTKDLPQKYLVELK